MTTSGSPFYPWDELTHTTTTQDVSEEDLSSNSEEVQSRTGRLLPWVFSIQACFYCVDSVIIVMLKNKATAKVFPDDISWWLNIWLYFFFGFHNSINSEKHPQQHWLKCSPKTWQSLHCVLKKAWDAHCFNSLLSSIHLAYLSPFSPNGTSSVFFATGC